MSQSTPSSTPKLTTLPLELKREIYSHLLAPNAIKFSTTKTNTRHIGLHFDTSLFRTSKALSDDALHFFYTQNKFILIKTHLNEFRDFIWRNHCCLPIIYLSSNDKILHHAVRLRVEEDDASFRCEEVSFLLPGKFFGKFLQLLYEYLHYGEGHEKMVVDMEFRHTSGMFEGTNGGANDLLRDVEDRCSGPRLPNSNEDIFRTFRDVRLEIHGDKLSSEDAGIIRSVMERKWPSLDTITTQSTSAVENGHRFRKEKNYLAACFEYQLAFLIYRRTTSGLSSHDRDREEDKSTTKIYHYLHDSYLNSDLGLHGAAEESAEVAGFNRTNTAVSVDDKMRVALQYYTAMADGGETSLSLQGLIWEMSELHTSSLVLQVMAKRNDLRVLLRAEEKEALARALAFENEN